MKNIIEFLRTASLEEIKAHNAAVAAAKLAKSNKRSATKRANEARAEQQFNAMPNVQRVKNELLYINSPVTAEVGFNLLEKIATKADGVNQFIYDVCCSVLKYRKASEKQAFVIARFADENNITVTF